MDKALGWPDFHREVAARGLTYAVRPAYFGPGATSGVKVQLAPYDEDEDQPPLERIVRHDAIQDVGRDSILDAALELLAELDSKSG